MAESFSKLQRAVGCLTGLAVGDAIGKQTETLTPSEIVEWYPDKVTGFHGELGSVIPRYQGKRYEWRVGETTDDTEQMKQQILLHLQLAWLFLQSQQKQQR
jgi:ADP-ribosylglycohydrolase